MSDWSVFVHVVRIAHGIGASVVCAAIFYTAGLFLAPRASDRLDNGVGLGLVGAALFVVLCWFGVDKGIPVSRMALIFGGAVALVAAVGRRKLRSKIADSAFRACARQSIIVFALLYVVAYLFTLPPAAPDHLPLAWTGNIDLMTYARYTRYFLHLGPSNVVDFSYANFVYLQTPGLFYLLGAFSLLFHQDPLVATMPAQFACVALTGTMAAAISRSVFHASARAGFAIACIFIAGPFFRYVAANYFLSTLMAMPVLLYVLSVTVHERPARLFDLSLGGRFTAAYILLLFIYPFLLFALVGLQIAATVFRCLADLQRCESSQTRAEAFRIAGRTLAISLGVFAMLAGLLWTRFAWSVDMIVSLSEKGVAGWPLAFISPQAMFAWPGVTGRAMQVAAESQRLATITFAGIAGALVLAYFWLFRSRTTAAQSTFAGLLAFVIVLYCAFFSILGPSYQQWKFASYSVLPLSFVLIAAAAQALSSLPRSAWAGRSHSDRRLLAALPVFIAIAIVAGNGAAHAAYDPALRRVRADLRAIEEIDELRSFQEITVSMNDDRDPLSTWLALYYLPHKRVHVVSDRFEPSAPLSLALVSRQRPLLLHNFGCEGVGHEHTMFVRRVGCVLFAPPTPKLDVVYPFNRTFLFVAYEGMTARTPDGRWNSRMTVPLKVSVDPERTAVSGPVYLNLSVRSKDARSPQDVTFRWSADKQAVAVIGSEAWLSLPVSSADWTGNRLWTLAIDVDVPQAGTLLFRELSISETPRGRVLGK